MVLSMLLSSTLSTGQLVLLLVCRKVAPNLTPDATVSMYGSLVSSEIFMHAISFKIAFALSNIFWYVTFQAHSVLAGISFLSDSHKSAVLGENSPKQ